MTRTEEVSGVRDRYDRVGEHIVCFGCVLGVGWVCFGCVLGVFLSCLLPYHRSLVGLVVASFVEEACTYPSSELNQPTNWP